MKKFEPKAQRALKRAFNLGYKHNQSPMKENKNEVHYPSLYLEKDCGLTSASLGKEITAEIKARVTSFSVDGDGETKKHRVTLDVMEIRPLKKTEG